jgi:hypothetical protein
MEIKITKSSTEKKRSSSSLTATVDVLVGSIARDDRVEGLGAVFALEALAMPHRALGEHLFGGKDGTAAAWTALTLGRLNRGRVDESGFWCVSLTVLFGGVEGNCEILGFGGWVWLVVFCWVLV